MAAAVALLACSCKCGKQQSEANPAEVVMQNILARKSVRSYTGDTIPAAVMEQLLRAAMAAPSGMDARPWQVVVLTNKEDYDRIFGDNFNMRMYRESGAVLILCADTMRMGRPREQPEAEPMLMPNPLWRDDMGAVTENLLLAVEAYGLGACWTACYPFSDRMEPIKQALSLPASVVPYSVVPIGYPVTDTPAKDKWDPARVHYNRW